MEAGEQLNITQMVGSKVKNEAPASEQVQKLQEELKSKEKQIVLMVCENSPRCYWPLAIVEETMHSNDGFVRRVKLRANGKIYERPISKLVLLLEYE